MDQRAKEFHDSKLHKQALRMSEMLEALNGLGWMRQLHKRAECHRHRWNRAWAKKIMSARWRWQRTTVNGDICKEDCASWSRREL